MSRTLARSSGFDFSFDLFCFLNQLQLNYAGESTVVTIFMLMHGIIWYSPYLFFLNEIRSANEL